MTPEERLAATKTQLDEAIEWLSTLAKKSLEHKEYLTANICYEIAKRLVTIEETLEGQ